MTPRSSVFALVACVVPLFSLAAQQPPKPAAKPATATAAKDTTKEAEPAVKPCPAEMLQPQQIAMASLQRNALTGAKSEADARKAILTATKNLYDPKASSNKLARDFLLAQFLTLAVEHGGDIQTRGNLGIPGDPNAMFDLVVNVDSLLTAVVKAEPQCKEEAMQWREYKPFMNLVNSASRILGTNPDSATYYAKRALILSPDSPYPYDVLWRAALTKGDIPVQIEYLQKALDHLGADSTSQSARANLLYTLGRIQQQLAKQKRDSIEQTMALFGVAAKTLMHVLKEYPSSEEAAYTVMLLTENATMSNDSALAADVLKQLRSAPEKYSDMALAQGGVLAANLPDAESAEALFLAATKANPYAREYWFNLALTLLHAKRYTDLLPVADKLNSMDPSNSGNFELKAYAYKSLSDVEKDPIKKKLYIDSTVVYTKLANDMQQKVSYTPLDRQKDKAVVHGKVENLAKDTKSYTIDFEFLGKNGEVLGKQTVTVADVPGLGKKEFTVELAKPGVMGVRYAPLK